MNTEITKIRDMIIRLREEKIASRKNRGVA